MSSLWWMGIDSLDVASAEDIERSNALADAARAHQWAEVLQLLGAESSRINSPRIGGLSGFAPLHQAAYGGAPLKVVQALVDMGAYRTLRTSLGDRPVDLARQRGYTHLLELLEPQSGLRVSLEKLRQVERGVHAVIRGRREAQPLLAKYAMHLPPLEILTEIPDHSLWFPVPGMYGGFHLQLGQVADEPICIVDSWIRVVGGSEERRLVSTAGLQEFILPQETFTITPPLEGESFSNLPE